MKTYIVYSLIICLGLWYADIRGIDFFSSHTAAKRGMNQPQPHHK